MSVLSNACDGAITYYVGENEEDVKLSTTGLVVRINDKVNRLINLTVKSDREGVTESVKDSFQDLTNYSIMARIVRSGKWGK